jgi:hypothetical protein
MRYRVSAHNVPRVKEVRYRYVQPVPLCICKKDLAIMGYRTGNQKNPRVETLVVGTQKTETKMKN